MRFPEWLYRLLPGDQGSQQLGIVWRENSSSQANATVSATVYTVPSDKCLVLTNVSMSSDAGAAQLVARQRCMADPPDGSVRYNIFNNRVAVQSGTFNWQGEVVVPGGWRVKAETNFDAGAAVNVSEAEIHGYLIPRGTFVFG